MVLLLTGVLFLLAAFIPQTQTILGFMYQRGLGVSQDYAEAAKWYRRAAERGYAGAQNNLGGMYARGEGVPQDYAEAVKWARLAAEQGYAPAQVNLGAAYARGEGVPQDYTEAVNVHFPLPRTLLPRTPRLHTWIHSRQPTPS